MAVAIGASVQSNWRQQGCRDALQCYCGNGPERSPSRDVRSHGPACCNAFPSHGHMTESEFGWREVIDDVHGSDADRNNSFEQSTT